MSTCDGNCNRQLHIVLYLQGQLTPKVISSNYSRVKISLINFKLWGSQSRQLLICLPSWLMSQMTTVHPNFANLSDRSLPSPPPPPVTSTTSPAMLLTRNLVGKMKCMTASIIWKRARQRKAVIAITFSFTLLIFLAAKGLSRTRGRKVGFGLFRFSTADGPTERKPIQWLRNF